jgi:aconitate hydratase
LPERIAPRSRVTVRAQEVNGGDRTRAFDAVIRIDTPDEAEYYRHGGILQYVLRQLRATA